MNVTTCLRKPRCHLAAWLLLAVSAPAPALASASAPPVATPADAVLVHDWLELEAQHARQRMRPAEAAKRPPAAPAVELVAIYGVGGELGAELRIGGVRHVLRPERGAGRATDGRGGDSIVAEGFAGACLRLRYRRTVRRVCLPAAIVPADARAQHG